MVIIKKIRCPKCNSGDTYARLLDFRCTNCNHIFKKEQIKLEDISKTEKQKDENIKRIEF